MVLVEDINSLTDYEGLGIEAFTLKQPRQLKINRGSLNPRSN